MSFQNYQTVYGVGLLDDLHNYFPSLLYDSSSFSSVQDVLQYVQQQTRNRFDLYSYGQREYNATRQVPPEPFHYSPRIRPSFASFTSAGQNRPVPRTSNFTNQPTNIVSYSIDIEEQTENEQEEANTIANATTQALLNLLNIPRGPIVRNYTNAGLDAFLQPVLVRPSAEQIAGNTTVGHFVSDTEQSCAICQDVLSGEQEARKLNVCGHWFHKNCIDTWFLRNVHCPVCRHDVRLATARRNNSAE
jgi:hypothetical protein